MIKYIALCITLAVSNVLAFEESCFTEVFAEQEQLFAFINHMNEISSEAQNSIHNIVLKFEDKAMSQIELKMDESRENRKEESDHDLCEIDFLKKALVDTMDNITCCKKNQWRKFKQMTFHGILELGGLLATKVDAVCRSKYINRPLTEFMFEETKKLIKEMQMSVDYMKLRYSLSVLNKAVETCAVRNLENLKHSVDEILFKYTMSSYNCTFLNELVKWEERPLC